MASTNVARIHGRNWDATNNRREAHDSLQGIKHSNWLACLIDRYFVFPKGEFALVAENGQRISLPTPILGALIALFIWIAGGTLAGVWAVASMSANVDNLTTTITREQARADVERKAEADKFAAERRVMQEKIELLDLKLADLREKQIRTEARRN